MSPFGTLRRIAADTTGRIAAARRRRRTRIEIESLPPHILKDIGWPAERRVPESLFTGR